MRQIRTKEQRVFPIFRCDRPFIVGGSLFSTQPDRMRTKNFSCLSLSCPTMTATVTSVVCNRPNTVVCDEVSNSQTRYFVVFRLLGCLTRSYRQRNAEKIDSYWSFSVLSFAGSNCLSVIIVSFSTRSVSLPSRFVDAESVTLWVMWLS